MYGSKKNLNKMGTASINVGVSEANNGPRYSIAISDCQGMIILQGDVNDREGAYKLKRLHSEITKLVERCEELHHKE